jgi:multimeric flavodoxin WrbA
MKVLAINGSPKKDGGTYLALKLVTDELNKAGIETETVHIGTEEIRGCTGCGYCKRNDKHLCIYADSVNDCLEKAKKLTEFFWVRRILCRHCGNDEMLP